MNPSRTLRIQIRGRRWLRLLAVGLALCLSAGLLPVQPAAAQPERPAGDNSLYVPLVMNDKCVQLRSSTVFGVQIYGATGTGSPYFKDLLDSGASWVRADLLWNVVEPTNTTPGNYSWASADAAVASALEECYLVLATLRHNPQWASDSLDGPIDKVDIAEFVEFVGAVVERYNGDGFDDAPGSPRVLYFELYNEPDAGLAGPDGRWGLHGDAYAAMLEAIYPAVKEANPQAQVVFGGIAHDYFTDADPITPSNNGPFIRTFPEDVLKSGGGPFFDIMNFHFYPLFGGNWTANYPKDGPGLFEKTAAIRALLQKYGLDKPIMVTEIGWHNNPGLPHGSDTLQVRMLQQLYAQSLAAGVSMAAWWPLGDLGGSYLLNSGLVTTGSDNNPPERKPAYRAYVTMVREFATARFAGEIAVTPDAKLYKFQDDVNGRIVYIGWTNQTDPKNVWGTPTQPYIDTTRAVSVGLGGTHAVVYDAYWREVTSSSDADDGKTDNRVKVKLDGDPKYIVVE